LTVEDAHARCFELGTIVGIRVFLARILNAEVNSLLCDILNHSDCTRILQVRKLRFGETT